ncbi:hypothetical protein OCGS_1114 [Oceaniovalibus guishaninsula JLT2003]|uniref:Uncharacterized protein n=1 Tax=Oceaniovalibus guishaninsula JLT2003 TaxID=1231392 RepID=K2GQ03_9RHOB|nr:hypothetical protein OCGS_1114 [Oceaniovalibus guishaninsula JLT2003]
MCHVCGDAASDVVRGADPGILPAGRRHCPGPRPSDAALQSRR